MPKKRKEEWKVWGNVFDNYTNRNLFKLKSQGYFERLESPISVGKEANIFTAETKEEKDTKDSKGKNKKKLVIVKIYRLETCNFNKMYDYIKQDPRYAGMKKQRRKIIFSWTQREYRNLLKAREVGVRVPLPLTQLDNILVLEYMGDDYIALQLKNHQPKNKAKFLNSIIGYMRLLWKKANLVHGDLSCFNILNYNENPVFIDFSQTTDIKSGNAKELLERDIKNVCTFFRKIGLKNLDEKKIMKKIVK
ncbi:MAG: serine protein kinase RIO [Candidatus Woesearchaeota archaeon]